MDHLNRRDPLITQLKARRVELGLSQAALGRRLRWRHNRISHLETGTGSPTLHTMRLWAAALEIELHAVAKPIRQYPQGPAPRQLCGTVAAAKRHREHGEAIDDACRSAEREYNRSRKRAQRRRAEAAA